MKKTSNKLICAAAMSTLLICSACGRQDDNAADDNNNTVTEGLTTDTNGSGQSDDTSQSGDAIQDNGIGTPNESDQNDSLQSGDITIDMETVEDSDTAEDGTILYSMSYVQPTVTIPGNDSASEKINADIQTRIDSFNSDDTLRNEAKEFYDETLTDADYIFNEYSETLDFEAMRSDTNVISFITTIYSYAGGTHGDYGRFGINYNSQTGELIAFDELSEDADKFHNDTLAYNRELAQTDEYKERMFTEDFIGEDELENVLYADEKWYLSNEGLVFISNPYELGPYAAGVIEFVIPYDALGEMGLKEGYRIP